MNKGSKIKKKLYKIRLTYLVATLTCLTLSAAWSVKPTWNPRASRVLQRKKKQTLITRQFEVKTLFNKGVKIIT